MQLDECVESSAAPRPRADAARRWARTYFSFPVLLAVGLVTVVSLTVANRFSDPDLWWHLKVGQIVWNTHALPSTDTFSYTTNQHAWQAHEWLAELSIYAAYLAGGYRALTAWVTVLASGLFLCVFLLCRMRNGDWLMAFCGGLGAWLFGAAGIAPRPLLLGYMFLAVELLVLEMGLRRARRWLYWLPPLFAVWVNCHGSYVFGMAVAAVYFGSTFLDGRWGLVVARKDAETRRTLGIVLALCAAALCLNPVGPRLLLYPFNLFFQQATNLGAVSEWQPPDPRELRGAALLAVFASVLLIPLLRRTELEVRELAAVAMAFVLAVAHVRMLFVFGIVAAPCVCGLLAAAPRAGGRKEEHPAVNAALVLCLIGAMAWAFPSPANIRQQIREANPVGAVDYIRRAGLHGPMLNEYQFGGYLIWAMPEEKVFIDGRADVFDWTGVFSAYQRWATLREDPQVLLNRYGIRLCVLHKANDMIRVMPYLPGWRKVYSDDIAEVFAR